MSFLLLVGTMVGVLALAPLDRRMKFSKDPVDQAQNQLAWIAGAIDMYRLTHAGRVPASIQELLKEVLGTGEPFLRRIPLDPWGRAFVFRALGVKQHDIRSVGPDGVLDTDDDVVWQRPEKR